MPSPHAPPVADKTTLDTSRESATQALYRAAIGPLNADYYQPIFSSFESTTKISLRWNTAASLYTLNWLVFRRLWRTAFIYFAILAGAMLLIFGLARLVFNLSSEVELVLLIATLMLSFVLPGLFGNAWLHADCRQRMAQALSHTTSLQQACERLAAQSSSRNRFLTLIAINLAAISAVAGHFLTGNNLQQSNEPPPLPITQTAPAPAMSAVSDESTTLPVVQDPKPAPVVALAIEAEPTPVPTAPEPVPVQAEVAKTEAPPTQTTPAVKSSKSAAAPYYVNVGLFANADNAERAHLRLKAAGLPVTTTALTSATGQRSRVRVGPYPSRAAANEAASAIRALELDAIVRQQ